MGSLLKILSFLSTAVPPLAKALDKAIDAFTEKNPKLGKTPEHLDLEAEKSKVLTKRP